MDKLQRMFTDRRNQLTELTYFLNKYRSELQKDENKQKQKAREDKL